MRRTVRIVVAAARAMSPWPPRRRRVGIGQHEARHPVSERRLADAVRPADQPGVRDAAAAIGIEQRLLGLGMAEQHGGLARMRRLGIISRFVGAHEATSLDRDRRGRGIEAISDHLPDLLGDRRASARWHRSARSARARSAPAGGTRRGASHGTPAIRPRSGRPLHRRAALARARARPRSAMSRIKVMSGLRSPTVMRSSPWISFGSTLPSMP